MNQYWYTWCLTIELVLSIWIASATIVAAIDRLTDVLKKEFKTKKDH